MPDSQHLKGRRGDKVRKSTSFLLTGILLAVTTASASAAEPVPEVDAHDAVVAYFLGGDEPNVEAASWSSEKEFNVGVHYMGSQENSFARYVCSILGSRGLGAGAQVNVIDINTMGLEPKQWEVVGVAVCNE
jgi:hypothetical protein